MSWDKFIGMLISRKNNNNDQITNHLFHAKKALERYPLGNRYGKLYFTGREGECMFGLLCGKTIPRVATDLSLSPRTVEFYLKNMKSKLRCRTKSELIKRILKTDFMGNYKKVNAVKNKSGT
jgi:DNA-binding NarL/FixJ family response regulator